MRTVGAPLSVRVAADGSTLPSFSAGSHVDVYLPGSVVRQYSLCNDPAEAHRSWSRASRACAVPASHRRAWCSTSDMRNDVSQERSEPMP